MFYEETTWEVAQKNCEKVDGNLASVQSIEENNFIFNSTDSIVTWLGASDMLTEGTWLWQDGTAWNFKNWARETGEPNGGTRENCLHLAHPRHLASRKWNDFPCSFKMAAICKKPVT